LPDSPTSTSSAYRQHFVAYQPVGGDGVAGVDRGLALPVGEAAAGFFYDRQQRGQVPDVDDRSTITSAGRATIR